MAMAFMASMKRILDKRSVHDAHQTRVLSGVPKTLPTIAKRVFVLCGLYQPMPSLTRGILGTRRPPIVNLSVTDVTRKLYRGVR